MEKRENESIYDRLKEYSEKDVCPMHMPGHKRNMGLMKESFPFHLDITEINDFDNLHDPEGIILEGQERAAGLYGSEHSFYLINGSTCGILAGIRAVVQTGDKVIMARNSHKSVYHGVELNELRPVYLLPEMDEELGIYGSVNTERVRELLMMHRDAALLILTSPTYEGVISDIKSIVRISHEMGIPVMVDEAHGAHLGFSPAFGSSAVEAGADIVIHSIHKTLPSLTQTSLAHVNGKLVDYKNFQRQLEIFETSSPSYILLSSIDSCVKLLCEEKDSLFRQYEENIELFDEMVEGLEKLRVLCHGRDKLEIYQSIYRYDSGKIVIRTKGTSLTGTELLRILREEYKIELEMAYIDYAIAMTSIGDERENFIRLADALMDIDRKINFVLKEEKNDYTSMTISLPKQSLSIKEAMVREGIFLPLAKAVGKVSKEYVHFYPPGVPILVPGEVIDEKVIQVIEDGIGSGLFPKSTQKRVPDAIEVVK